MQTFLATLLLSLSAAGASDGSDRHRRRLRARTSTQSSDDGAFSSDDDDCDVDQLAEEEARALELTFGSEDMFGLNEEHRRATYRNVSDAQEGEERSRAVCGRRDIDVIGARRVDEVCGAGRPLRRPESESRGGRPRPRIRRTVSPCCARSRRCQQQRREHGAQRRASGERRSRGAAAATRLRRGPCRAPKRECHRARAWWQNSLILDVGQA
jgi:hypothetical protein